MGENCTYESLVGGTTIIEAKGHIVVVVSIVRLKVVLGAYRGFIQIWLYSSRHPCNLTYDSLTTCRLYNQCMATYVDPWDIQCLDS